jgi:hypothetical protein
MSTGADLTPGRDDPGIQVGIRVIKQAWEKNRNGRNNGGVQRR